MVFPWMFEELNALKPFKEAAHLLAEKEDWPPLYDISILKNNKVRFRQVGVSSSSIIIYIA